MQKNFKHSHLVKSNKVKHHFTEKKNREFEILRRQDSSRGNQTSIAQLSLIQSKIALLELEIEMNQTIGVIKKRSN